MVTRSRTLSAAFIAVALCVGGPASGQEVFPPTAFFGKWIWNGQRTKVDPGLGNYRCYVEVLEELDGGRVRMRDA